MEKIHQGKRRGKLKQSGIWVKEPKQESLITEQQLENRSGLGLYTVKLTGEPKPSTVAHTNLKSMVLFDNIHIGKKLMYMGKNTYDFKVIVNSGDDK